MKDQRKVSNIFVRSSLISKYGRYVFFMWGLALGLSILSNWYLSQSLNEIVLPLTQPENESAVANIFEGYLFKTLAINITIFTVLIWGLLAFLTVINHRVYGPMEFIKDFIGHLKEGNYDPPKRTLRKEDELLPLMEELNELADSLKETTH